jgi:hypothetical protein
VSALTLEDHIASLQPEQQWQIAWEMASAALPIWEAYAREGRLGYLDSAVGMAHQVAPDLLARALAEAKVLVDTPEMDSLPHGAGRMHALQAEFRDPVSALQDMDWKLPAPVQLVFYAVSNLVDALAGQAKTVLSASTHYVVVNQAVDALQQTGLLQEEAIRAILYQFGERA